MPAVRLSPEQEQYVPYRIFRTISGRIPGYFHHVFTNTDIARSEQTNTSSVGKVVPLMKCVGEVNKADYKRSDHIVLFDCRDTGIEKCQEVGCTVYQSIGCPWYDAASKRPPTATKNPTRRVFNR